MIAHSVGQVVIPQNFDRRNLLKTFRPFSIDRIAEGISKELRPFLANGRKVSSLAFEDMGITSLGIEQGTRDVLAMGHKTRLIGTAQCAELSLSTTYGEAVVPFSDVAAIAGKNKGLRDKIRVFLRDGQIFSGKATAKELNFSLANGGKMQINLNDLDRLILVKTENQTDWPSETAALIETHDGDCLRIGKDENPSLTVVTPWGEMVSSVSDLIWLGPYEGEPVGHFVELKNGNSSLGFLSGDSLELQSNVFGAHSIELRRIRRIITDALSEREKYHSNSGLDTKIRVTGNQQIVGAIENSRLQFVSNAQVIEMAPGEIRRMNRLDHSGNGGNGSGVGVSLARPGFRVEMWDGGVIDGFMQLDYLTLKVGSRNWQIPLADIEELESPVPSLGENARKQIEELLVQLGADQWAVREKATKQLGAFGYLASPILQKEVHQNSDPEIRRRIERVLAEMEP